MGVKKMVGDLIKYGSKSSKNRREAVEGALAVISYLTKHEKAISLKALKKLSAGDSALNTDQFKKKISDDYDVYCS